MNERTGRTRNAAGLTVEEQMEWIELLYNEGKTDAQIGEVLGINRTLVTRLRNEMKLVARRGRTVEEFTPEQDERIVELYEEHEFNWAQIARELGIKDRRRVAERYDAINLKREREDGHCSVAKSKKCLKCRKPFETFYPKHEWTCDSCRSSNMSYSNGWGEDYQVA